MLVTLNADEHRIDFGPFVSASVFIGVERGDRFYVRRITQASRKLICPQRERVVFTPRKSGVFSETEIIQLM